MKLNPDCVRDILLTVEENTDFSSQMPYPNDEVEYPRKTILKKRFPIM